MLSIFFFFFQLKYLLFLVFIHNYSFLYNVYGYQLYGTQKTLQPSKESWPLKPWAYHSLFIQHQILRTLRKQNLTNFSRVVEKEKIKKRAGLYRDLEDSEKKAWLISMSNLMLKAKMSDSFTNACLPV